MKIKRCRSFVILGLLLPAVYAIHIRADVTYIWIASSSGADWLTASNWSSVGQPSYSGVSGDGDMAIIDTLPGAALVECRA